MSKRIVENSDLFAWLNHTEAYPHIFNAPVAHFFHRRGTAKEDRA